ncbi:unnamed protein product [Schistocephalus solidus]|uniref:Secreted protein n=1 Tax=Schistocephalus solidus TaxID=70667 RepID=A0A183SV01_SCHSO|nr:unnamed protein product [Schistocephalus solidus]
MRLPVRALRHKLIKKATTKIAAFLFIPTILLGNSQLDCTKFTAATAAVGGGGGSDVGGGSGGGGGGGGGGTGGFDCLLACLFASTESWGVTLAVLPSLTLTSPFPPPWCEDSRALAL